VEVILLVLQLLTE